MRSKQTFKGGVPADGPFLIYWHKGRLMQKGSFKDGGFEGLFEGYHENGQLAYAERWKDGLKDGKFVRYYPNGEVRFQGMMKDGEACGEWIWEGESTTLDPCDSPSATVKIHCPAVFTPESNTPSQWFLSMCAGD